jgi:hypothetical protein
MNHAIWLRNCPVLSGPLQVIEEGVVESTGRAKSVGIPAFAEQTASVLAALSNTGLHIY